MFVFLFFTAILYSRFRKAKTLALFLIFLNFSWKYLPDVFGLEKWYNFHMNNRIKDIYMQYYSMVIGVAYKVVHNMDTSSDVAAEVFLKLIENMKVKNDIKNIKAWLCVVTRYTACDYLDKNNKVSLLDEVPWYLNTENFTAVIHGKIFAEEILNKLYKKNKKWFDICLMHYLLGMSIKEISEFYKCTENSIEGNLYRARKYIQKNYSSLEIFYLISFLSVLSDCGVFLLDK